MYSRYNITDKRRRVIAVIAALLFLYSGSISAQMMDTRRQVDTLSLAERISVRTNMVDWTLMIPNVGVEFDLGKTNYSRYAVNLNLRYRPVDNGTYAKPITFGVTEVRIEGRQYWRERQAEPFGVMRRHTKIWDKLMSCRRMAPKHPKTTYYRGLYLAYDNFNIRVPKVFTTGQRGHLITAGVTWGFVRPLYGFPNGNTVDMEIGISGGVGMMKCTDYRYDSTDGTNEDFWNRSWDIVKKPVITDLHVGFVYRFGKYPIQKKYRWRYDVDMEYRARMDEAYLKTDSVNWQKYVNDSLYKVADAEFRNLYDSIVAVHAVEKQETIDNDAKEYLRFLESMGQAQKVRTRAQQEREKAIRKSDEQAIKEEE